MIAGGCRCGACRYTLAYDQAPLTYACHCLDCQTMSGGGFALQALIPTSRFAISGDLLEWARANSKGKITTQYFCAACMTRLHSANEGRPGTVIVRAGTLDDSAALSPAAHMWAKRKLPWVGLPEGSETYAEGIPPERFMALFAPNFA